jgi:hypothetical protein
MKRPEGSFLQDICGPSSVASFANSAMLRCGGVCNRYPPCPRLGRFSLHTIGIRAC